MSLSKNDVRTYQESLQLASEHYENFPVASFLFPKHLRKDVALIYRFARTADDIADEGDMSAEQRLEMLSQFREDFNEALKGNYSINYWKLLHSSIQKRSLTPQHLHNLLSAFEQDIFKNEYETYEELTAYCNNSASPVGRIILELYKIDDENVIKHSDEICTALQLTNFWQDVSVDLKKGRIYIPLEDFSKFQCNKSVLFSEQMPEELRQIIKLEVERTEKLFDEGSKILQNLPLRLKWQIKWTINGGKRILKKIEKNNYDVLNYRPTLTKINYIIALFR